MNLHPGAFIRLADNQDHAYQVVSIDDHADRCWVRRWPLTKQGSPPFAVPFHQVTETDLAAV